MMLHPPTLAQVPLPLSATTSNGSAAALSKCNGLSVCASSYLQTREKLTCLLSFASLADSALLVKVVVSSISLITRLHAEKCADLEDLFLPDGSTPSPDDIIDLLSIARYGPTVITSQKRTNCKV